MGVTSTEPVAADDAKIDESDVRSSLRRRLKLQNFGSESESEMRDFLRYLFMPDSIEAQLSYYSIKEPERKMGVTSTELVPADDAKTDEFRLYSFLARRMVLGSAQVRYRQSHLGQVELMSVSDILALEDLPRWVQSDLHCYYKDERKVRLIYDSIEQPERAFPRDGCFKLEGTKWKLFHCLGKGGYGTVYKAITNRGARCAVKVVHLSDHNGLPQLQRETQMYSQYKHENIVRYLGAYKDSENLYVFLEFMPNGSLETVYKKRSLTDSEVSAITWHILNGLEFLHDMNVIHR